MPQTRSATDCQSTLGILEGRRSLLQDETAKSRVYLAPSPSVCSTAKVQVQQSTLVGNKVTIESAESSHFRTVERSNRFLLLFRNSQEQTFQVPRRQRLVDCMIVGRMLRPDIQRHPCSVDSKTRSKNRFPARVSPGRSHTTRRC